MDWNAFNNAQKCLVIVWINTTAQFKVGEAMGTARTPP